MLHNIFLSLLITFSCLQPYHQLFLNPYDRDNISRSSFSRVFLIPSLSPLQLLSQLYFFIISSISYFFVQFFLLLECHPLTAPHLPWSSKWSSSPLIKVQQLGKRNWALKLTFNRTCKLYSSITGPSSFRWIQSDRNEEYCQVKHKITWETAKIKWSSLKKFSPIN